MANALIQTWAAPETWLGGGGFKTKINIKHYTQSSEKRHVWLTDKNQSDVYIVFTLYIY